MNSKRLEIKQMSDAKTYASIKPLNVEKNYEDMSTEEKMKVFKNVEVVHHGSTITLPATPVPMDLRTGAAWLEARADQEEQMVGIYEIIEGIPLDALHAFTKSLLKQFGFIKQKSETFLWIEKPPQMLGVTVSPDGDTVHVPFGQMEVPGVEGYLHTRVTNIDGKIQLVISGEVRNKSRDAVNRLIQNAREYLKTHSIYKGMAIKVKFNKVSEEESANPFKNQPRFIKTADIRPEELIFNNDVEQLMRVNLWSLISHLPTVRRAQIPVKRGILLHGKPGVGKTLTALATARLAVQNDVTFIELADGKQLPQAIDFARSVQPAVIFVEDIDRLDDDGKRTDYFNEVLNVVDGLTSKDEEIIVVFTTNYVEKINHVMLRPGRLDAVIEIEPPDADSVNRLIRLYSRDMLDPMADLGPVGAILSGEIPAVVREVVERAKLTAITRGEIKKITPEDIRISAIGMKKHLELLKPKDVDRRSDLEKAAMILAEAFGVGTTRPGGWVK